jgi:hypothetical protein
MLLAVSSDDGRIRRISEQKAVFPFVKTRDIISVRNNDNEFTSKNDVIDSDTGFSRCL